MAASGLFFVAFPALIEFLLYFQLCFGLVGAPAGKPLDPARLLPERALGFVTLARDAQLARAWEAGLAALAAGERDELAHYLRQFNVAGEMGFKREALPELGRQVQALHLCFDGATREAPSFALLLETTSADAAAGLVKDLDRYLSLAAKPQELEAGGHKLLRFRLGQPSRAAGVLGRHEHVIVFSLAPEGVAKYLGWLKAPPEKSLAGTERFKRSLFAGNRRPATGFYLDLKNLLGTLRELMDRRDQLQLDKVDSILGLSDMHMVQGGLAYEATGASLRAEILHDPASRPLSLILPAGAPADAGPAKLLAPDCGFVLQLSLKETGSLLALRDFLVAREKELETNAVSQAFQEIERFLGDPLATFLKEVDGQALVAMGGLDLAKLMNEDDEEGAGRRRDDYPGPPFTFVVPFKDEAAGLARFRKIAAFIAGQTGGAVEEKQRKGVTYLEFARRPRAAGAMVGKHLVITFPAENLLPILARWEGSEKQALDPRGLARIAETPATFRASYSLPGSLVMTLGLFIGRSFGASAPAGPGDDFKPKKTRLERPALRLRTAALDSTFALERAPGALRFASALWNADYPAQALESLRLVAHLQRTSCMSNYRQLHLAWQKYAHVKKAAPKSFDELKKARQELKIYYLPGCPAHPRSRDAAGYLMNSAPSEKVEEQSRVLIYDRAGQHWGGRFVLFADGAVRWVATEAFAKLSKDNGLPETDPAEPGPSDKKPDEED